MANSSLWYIEIHKFEIIRCVNTISELCLNVVNFFPFSFLFYPLEITIETCIIFYAKLDWPRSMTHLCEYECVEVYVCTASRETDECNCSIGSVVWQMMRQSEC